MSSNLLKKLSLGLFVMLAQSAFAYDQASIVAKATESDANSVVYTSPVYVLSYGDYPGSEKVFQFDTTGLSDVEAGTAICQLIGEQNNINYVSGQVLRPNPLTSKVSLEGPSLARAGVRVSMNSNLNIVSVSKNAQVIRTQENVEVALSVVDSLKCNY